MIVNLPSFENRYKMDCYFDIADESFHIRNTSGKDAEFKLHIGSVCATTNEALSQDIVRILIEMRAKGFEEGRKHVRDALGIET
jgi:hypothetical protein